uniref:Uncharacterized protein n=1 Tax=Eutreptiella gymnastica TaxID=73025 RepID=A0A7S4FVE8_9EUGL|mmetsp:Transcript_13232/g.20852  ORF Transcript_13232/g.20852 Transcript_13232/m.20852 type:complete len:106 (-) Transcript_13232:154-471(-)
MTWLYKLVGKRSVSSASSGNSQLLQPTTVCCEGQPQSWGQKVCLWMQHAASKNDGQPMLQGLGAVLLHYVHVCQHAPETNPRTAPICAQHGTRPQSGDTYYRKHK